MIITYALIGFRVSDKPATLCRTGYKTFKGAKTALARFKKTGEYVALSIRREESWGCGYSSGIVYEWRNGEA